MKKTNKRLNLILSAVILYILFIVLSSTISFTSNETRHYFDVESINLGSLKTAENKSEEVSIPHKVNSKENFTLSVDISKYSGKQNYSIATYANFSNLDVFAGDRLIYQKNSDPNKINGSGGYYVIYFEIPNDLKTNKLDFTFKPLLDSLDHTMIEKIYIGKQSDLILSIAISDSAILMIAVLFLLNFSIVFVFALKNKDYFEKENYGLLHLAIIGLISALYFCSQSWILKYIFPDLNCFIHIVAFSSLAIIPIPILLFFKYQLDPKYKNLYNYLNTILLANVIIQSALALSGTSEYINMLIITQALLLLTILLIIYTFLKTDTKKYPSKKKFIFPIISTILVVLIPLISYFIYDTISFNKLSFAAAISFLILEISEFKYTYYNYRKEIKDKEAFKRLATTDPLTGLSNRTHFNYFTHKLSESKNHVKAWIIIIDLDKLKKVNDEYGHIAGDEYIKYFANLLKEESEKNNFINPFRIGGDEFFVFIENDEKFKVKDWINALKNKFSNYKLYSDDFKASFSAGYYYFDSEIDNIKEIGKYYNIADKKMYEDKKRKTNNTVH